LAAGVALQRLIIEANSERPDAATISGVLAEAYLLHGIEAWTLVDDKGIAVAVSEETIRSRLLSDFSLSAPVADAADGLYMGPVILPLVEKASKSLPTTRTNGSTSAASSTPLKRSKRSSTTTTPMGSTEATSSAPAGVSS
jgi:hypothetical protein